VVSSTAAAVSAAVAGGEKVVGLKLWNFDPVNSLVVGLFEKLDAEAFGPSDHHVVEVPDFEFLDD
jgi:hypothetical protein